jgi:hypothetical protein
LNPYLAGGLFVDYVVHGRYQLIPKDLTKLEPEDLEALTSSGLSTENRLSASAQVHSAAAAGDRAEMSSAATANSDLKEIVATHE